MRNINKYLRIMKNYVAKSISIMMVIGLVATFFISPSCKKNTDCTAIIHVIDTAGAVVSGATVTLYKTNVTQYNGVTANVSDVKISDGSGVTTHVFALPAVLDITAVIAGKTGKGVVRLQEGESVEQTVRVY